MVWSDAGDPDSIPYITEENGLITEVSPAFCSLTRYNAEHLLGETIPSLFRILMRNRTDIPFFNEEAEAVFFTRQLEGRMVRIQREKKGNSRQTRYVFTLLSSPVLEEKYPFLEKIRKDNVTGVGIFSVPGYVLLLANQTFLSYLPGLNPFGEQVYGTTFQQLFPEFDESSGGKGWRHFIETDQTIYIREKKGLTLDRDNRYWDSTLVPIRENGRTRYLVMLLDDVTKRVFSREHLTNQTKIILKQKERAEILWEAAGKLLASDRPQEVVEDICGKVMEFLECHTFFNYMADPNAGRLHLNACAGVSDKMAAELEWLDYGVSVCGCAARDGCRTVVENIQEIDDERTNLLKSIGIRAYACHPLMEQNRVTGTLAFGTNSRDSFSEDDLALMKAVADQVAVAINRMRTEQMLAMQQQLMIRAEMEKSDALKKAMEMKDEFLSLISHEFKTPLTVIYSAVQAMKFVCRNELTEKANGFLNKILQNSNRQLKLVNNLLDITRANAGHLKVIKTNIEIVGLTRSITDSIRVFAEQKGIRLSFFTTLRHKIIGTDEEKFERILLNLLSNAVKYTPEGKSIDVRVFQKVICGKCMVCIQVRDKGFGVPEDMADLIFERFGQVDRSLSRQAEGTGIGLYLVKMLVELLGGQITLDSKVGKGSKFTVFLPVGKGKEAPPEPVIQQISDKRLIRATAIEFSDIYLPS